MSDKKAAIKQHLSETKAALDAILQNLIPEHWELMVFSDGDSWTIQDMITHLVEAEMGMSIQVHKIRQGKETIPTGFDLDKWNSGVKQRMGELSPTELIQKMAEVRAQTLARLDTIEEHEWALQGRHPSMGMSTIEQYYQIIAAHQQQHAADIQRAVASV